MQTPEELQNIEDSITKTRECVVKATQLYATVKAKHAALSSQPTDAEIAEVVPQLEKVCLYFTPLVPAACLLTKVSIFSETQIWREKTVRLKKLALQKKMSATKTQTKDMLQMQIKILKPKWKAYKTVDWLRVVDAVDPLVNQ